MCEPSHASEDCSTTVINCGDHRLNSGYWNIRMIEEAMTPFFIKHGLPTGTNPETGEPWPRYDYESRPGPVIPLLMRNDEEAEEARGIARDCQVYNTLARGEHFILSAHMDCGRVGVDGGNQDRRRTLRGLQEAALNLQGLTGLTCAGAMLIHVNDKNVTAVEMFTLEELDKELENLDSESGQDMLDLTDGAPPVRPTEGQVAQT